MHFRPLLPLLLLFCIGLSTSWPVSHKSRSPSRGSLCGTNGDCLSQKWPSSSSGMFHGWQLLLTAEHAALHFHLALVLTTVGFGRRAQELICALKKRETYNWDKCNNQFDQLHGNFSCISSLNPITSWRDLDWLVHTWLVNVFVFVYYLVCLQWLLCEHISGKLRFSAKERLVQLLLRLSYVDCWNVYPCLLLKEMFNWKS